VVAGSTSGVSPANEAPPVCLTNAQRRSRSRIKGVDVPASDQGRTTPPEGRGFRSLQSPPCAAAKEPPPPPYRAAKRRIERPGERPSNKHANEAIVLTKLDRPKI
jgi:hypothetical protein